MKRTPTTEQQLILDSFSEHKVLKINAIAGAGKEQPVSTPTPTPNGIICFGDLRVGDQVFGKNGQPTEVTAIFPQGMKDVYEVTFRDGSKTRCGLEHNWSVATIAQRDKAATKTLTTAELLAKGVVTNAGNYRFKIPMASAVEFPEKNLILHPYILGAMLGNGTLQVKANGSLSTPALSFHKDDGETYERVKTFFKESHNITLTGEPRFTSENGQQVNLCVSHGNTTNPVTQLFKELGITSSNKHIPQDYLQGSVQQRLFLLQGLMDTDGCVSNNRTSFSNTNIDIIRGITFLVESLGGTAILRKTDERKTPCYALNIKMPCNPFLLKRKNQNWKPSWKNPPSRYITKIEKLDVQEEQMCITVAAEDSLYLTNNFIVTHNTSTLQMLAEANEVPSLYVCFNKANATEASERFPTHITCRTLHSLAFSAFGKNLMHKLSSSFKAGEPYVNKARSNKEIASLYKVPDLHTSVDTMVTQRATAGLVKLTVGRYQNSASEHIAGHHIPSFELKKLAKNHPDLDLEKYCQVIINFANKLWKDRIDPLSPVQAEHDTYLKLWQLSKPKLAYDIIYVDEAQDTNPVAFDILKNQDHCKMVYVGDSYQSIYGFRMAVNAMEEVNAPTFLLSKSFRYGQAIADLATFIIRDGIAVKGLETIDSQLGSVSHHKHTMIFRTNSYLIQTAVNLISQGLKVFANIDTRKFENQLLSVQALHDGDLKGIKDDDIGLYSSWDEFVEAGEEMLEYKRLIQIVEQGTTYRFLKAVQEVKKNKDYHDVLLTTAHKSKGMEWDYVTIADDFPEKTIFAEELDPFIQQEVNLFYVALTRAIKVLKIPAEFTKRYNQSKAEVFDWSSEGLTVGNVSLCQIEAHTPNTVIKNLIAPVADDDLYVDEDCADADLRAHYLGG